MDTLYLKYTQDRLHGLKVEYEKSYHGTWNTITLTDAIQTLKSWTKELEKEFKDLDKGHKK
jgi:hypothetical protein